MTGETFLSLIEILVVLFLLIATGFFARKKGIIDDAASKRLSKLIVNIGQPMLIVSSLTKVEYSDERAKEGLIMFGIGMAIHSFLAIFAFFSTKWIKNIDERKVSEYSIVFANAGFIGFPILRSIFGDIGEFWGSFYVISFHIFVWTCGMLILGRGRDDIKLTVRKIFFNLGTIPCLIGIGLYFMTKWIPLPQFVASYTGFLANLCTPISVLIVGALIATQTPKQLFCDPKVYFVALCRLIVCPIIVCLIEKLIGLPSDFIFFSVAVAGMPSASNITMFGEIYDIAPGYASVTVGVTSLLTVATLPLVMLITNIIV